MPTPLDLRGQSFGRWRVIGPAPERSKHRCRLWIAECQCGTRARRSTSELRCGKSLSCGCWRGELLAERNRNVQRDRSGRRICKPKPPRHCDHCGREYEPKRSRSKYCSDECRARARWRKIAADPQRKAAHARRVTEAHKRDTYVDHDACAECGKPFRAPPQRRYCSRDCLGCVIRSGKYRRAFLRRRAEMELAAINKELEDRL